VGEICEVDIPGTLVMTRRFGANPLLLGDPSEGCLQSVDKA